MFYCVFSFPFYLFLLAFLSFLLLVWGFTCSSFSSFLSVGIGCLTLSLLLLVLASVRAVCTLPGLWHHFGPALANGLLEGTSPQKMEEAELVVLAGL